MQRVWCHLSQKSHCTPLWFILTGLLQIPQGTLSGQCFDRYLRLKEGEKEYFRRYELSLRAQNDGQVSIWCCTTVKRFQASSRVPGGGLLLLNCYRVSSLLRGIVGSLFNPEPTPTISEYLRERLRLTTDHLPNLIEDIRRVSDPNPNPNTWP